MRKHLTEITRLGLIAILMLTLGGSNLTAQNYRRGVEGRQAPAWGVDQWLNLPDGKKTLDIDDYNGKVLYLYGFQSWCPGCHSHGFPTLSKMISKYADNDKVAFVAIQTVFEGFGTNTFKAAERVGQQYSLDIPIGHSGSDDQRSIFMARYRTGGTPWTIIIDKQGVVRYNDFRIEVPGATRLIDALLEEAMPQEQKLQLPDSRGELDMLGKKFSLTGLRWLNTDDNEQPQIDGKVTLLRWWTNTCKFCAASLPPIDKLGREFEDTDFQRVAVYHPKPPRNVGDKKILDDAHLYGFNGIVAADEDWSVLNKNYLDIKPRRFTSVSFLLDRDGIVRFIHPGPELRLTSSPGLEQAASDYQDLRTAIRALLASN